MNEDKRCVQSYWRHVSIWVGNFTEENFCVLIKISGIAI
jgi:hypothetical protein